MIGLTFFFLVLFFGFFDFFYFYFLVFFLAIFMFLNMSSFCFSGIFFCDSFSFFLLYLTMVVYLFCFFSSMFDEWKKNYFSSFFFVLSSMFLLLWISFTSFNVFVFYVCFEFIFMFMYFFIMSWGYSPERVQASFYMVFYTIVVSFPFLVYMLTFEHAFFTLKFLSFFEFSSYWSFFLFLVFLVKLPVYGVHLWLPKAHVEAPVSGSMVLAGVLLKLGGYGIFRFSSFVPKFFFNYSGYFLSIGLLGGLLSCLICLRQVDLKSFVAYSSICHMGFGLAGFYSYSLLGFTGGVYMLMAHGFCSSCLFYLLYVFYERFHTRSLFVLKGVGFLFPSFLLSWFVFSVLNMGVPPSFSFFSEVFILVGLIGLSMPVLFFSGMFLFLAGLYGIYFYVVSCHGFSIINGLFYNMTLREFLNIYGHFFPLVFIPFFILFFFV